MTKTLLRASSTRCFRIALAAILAAGSLPAAELKEGHVTQVIKDVKLLPSQAAPRPAVVNDPVRAGTAVRTGVDSRTELTFSDLTIARLGANTIFSLSEGTRTIDLSGGAILVRVPKDSGGAKITTSAVTAAITGTTMLAEFHKDSIYKFIMLEGQSRITRAGHPEESVTLHSGEMLSGDPRKPLGTPVTVDVKKVVESSRLIQDFGPLGSEALMADVFREQEALVANQNVNLPNNIFRVGTDDLNAIQQRIAVAQTEASPTPTPPPSTPTPTPDKFGVPQTITSANLSIIDGGTVIQTDPSITRNGETGFGKIYRGPDVDGPASIYLFGSTSAFDTASGFDDQIDSSGAAFKFTSLQLNGSPTISTTDGEINLGLVGVNGITAAGTPGALTTLTFAGIRGMLLATQNGSINIGAGFAFSGLHDLTFYARGAGSNLTLGAAISTTSQLTLYSEGDVNLSGNVSTRDFRSFSGGNFNLTSASFSAETISIISGANVSVGFDGGFFPTNFLLQAAGNIQVSDSLIVDQSTSPTDSEFNISVLAGGTLNVGAGVFLRTFGDSGQGGGNIVVTSGGDMSIGGSLDAQVAGGVSGTTVNGANITVHSGGFLSASGEAFFGIFNSAGTNSSNATFDIRANSFSVGGSLDALLDNFNGGTVVGNAEIELTISGSLTVQQAASFEIANFSDGTGPGSIGGSARIDVVAGSLTANSLDASIDNENGGSIGAFAEVNFSMPNGALTTQGEASFGISNDISDFSHGTLGATGGRIGDSAIVDITAASISTGGGLSAFVRNSNGGTIGSDAQVKLHAGAISTGAGISTEIFNQSGAIGENALINFVCTGNVVTNGFDSFAIRNDSGAIGDDANISVTIGGNHSSGRIEASIDNRHGMIGSGANITYSVGGNMISSTLARFVIDNSNGAAIALSPAIQVTANNIMTAGDFSAYIDTANNGAPTSDSGRTVRIESFGDIHVGGRLNVLGSVISDGDVDAETIAATSIDTQGGGDIRAGLGGITRFAVPGETAPDVVHTLTARFVTSDGGINFDGADASVSSPATNGVALTINANSLSFDVEGDILGSVTFNGGNGFPEFAAGSGGTFIANTTGDILVAELISATTGNLFGGAGGSVTLNSAGGMVTVNDTILVSSNDTEEGAVPRVSDSGGNITIHSVLTTGLGIRLNQGSALLSLLSASAPGPGGLITLSTRGADVIVNGLIEADRGTITIDQNDPLLGVPLITIDGATLISDTLNVHGIGDLNVAQTILTTLTFATAVLAADDDVNWNVANTTLPASISSLDLTSGNAINLTGGDVEIPAVLNLNLTSSTTSTFTAGAGGINAEFTDILFSGSDLNLVSGGNITAHSIQFTDFFVRGNVSAAGAISITGDLQSGGITAGTTIDVGGQVLVGGMTAGGNITVSGRLAAFGDVNSTNGNITAGTVAPHGINAPNGLLTAGSGGILPFIVSPGGAGVQQMYVVDSILSPNGIDFSGNQYDGIDGLSSGGMLTINARTIAFDSEIGVGSVNFNGADVDGFSSGTTPTVPGDGGTFAVNATDDITTIVPITASSGLTNFNGTIGGAGGTVTFNSSAGTVAVNSTIQVSHAEVPDGPVRRSAKGGNIHLSSGKAAPAGVPRPVAIDVGSSGQLLALLDAAAPGPGGKIVISATGANSDVNVRGRVQADRGVVDIRHTGDGGNVALEGFIPSVSTPGPNGSLGTLDVRGDVVKVAALGTNGLLTIGNGSISADSTLQLYATGFNGEVRFVGNAILSGNSVKSIAGNAVTINNGIFVFVGGPAASVYVNSTGGIPNANYSGQSGGNNTTTGMFTGSGANPPQPLSAAPPLGPPPTRPGG